MQYLIALFMLTYSINTTDLSQDYSINQEVSSQLELYTSIVETAIETLFVEELLEDSGAIRVILYDEGEIQSFGEYTLKGRQVKSLTSFQSPNVILHIANISESKKIVHFDSFGGGGCEHSGTINLVKKEDKWSVAQISYMSAIE